MATHKIIPIASIHIGERARPIDEDHALAIAASMAERGLINPITVRHTPATNKGKTPYTLVAGGHRLRAGELNQWQEIDCVVVVADAVEAQLIELSENLFRNELSKLERPLFVMKFREIFEEKHGKIERGGDRKSNCNDCSLIFSPGKELSERIQERLGFSERTYFNVLKIGQNLRPELRTILRGTSTENDQSMLLKLAKLPSDEQVRIAAALKHDPDINKALAFTKPDKAEAQDMGAALLQPALFAKLVDAWKRADDDTRDKFLVHIGMAETVREAAE